MKGSTAFIKSILGLFVCDTDSLIDMYAILQQSNKTGKKVYLFVSFSVLILEKGFVIHYKSYP